MREVCTDGPACHLVFDKVLRACVGWGWSYSHRGLTFTSLTIYTFVSYETADIEVLYFGRPPYQLKYDPGFALAKTSKMDSVGPGVDLTVSYQLCVPWPASPVLLTLTDQPDVYT